MLTRAFELVLVFLLHPLIVVKCMNDGGPVGQIVVHTLGPCDPDTNQFKLETVLKEENDEKELTITLDLPFDLPENTELLLVVDKWKDDSWEKEVYKKEGEFFSFLNEYLPAIWENIRATMMPNIPDSNSIKAGTYTLQSYKDVSENCELPQILYGKFLAAFHFFKDGEEIACMMSEADSFEP